MTVLVRGHMNDRPWGRTLASFYTRRITAQVQIVSENKRYELALVDGVLIAAISPMASDSAARAAVTAGVLTSVQATEANRRAVAQPNLDEIEVMLELTNLPYEQQVKLRRRCVATKAIRTFALEQGEFVVDDDITMPIPPDAHEAATDMRALIFLGARTHISAERLGAELLLFGTGFHLPDASLGKLVQYGFTDSERAVLTVLRENAVTLEDIDAASPDVRTSRAAAYALAAMGALETSVITIRQPAGEKAAPAPSQVAAAVVPPPTPPTPVPPPRVAPSAMPSPTPPTPVPPPARTPTRPPPRKVPASPTESPTAIRELINSRLALIEKDADHFALLGVTRTMSPDLVRKEYFRLAKLLHPDRVVAVGITDAKRSAQRVFAQINAAFAVLSNKATRAEYVSVLEQGGAAAIQSKQAAAEKLAMRLLEAEEHFNFGEMALRRNQYDIAQQAFRKAVELNPDEADHHSLLAWTTFVAAPEADKHAVAATSRGILERAAKMAPRSPTSRLYLGRIARLLDQDNVALRHFRDALEIAPQHVEIAAELRVLESRLRK